MDKILYTIKKLIPIKIFKKLQPIYHFLFNYLAAIVYKHPSDELIVIGVTGTTGKTTSVYLLAKTLENAGFKVGYTSTAMFNNGEREWMNDKKMTMIGRFFTQKILRQMVENNCQYAIVETTSEGVRQFRHRFINYDILVFTGLYPEHIDSHGSFENYKNAKGQLFAHLKNCKTKFKDKDGKIVNSNSELGKLDFQRIKKTIIANGDDEHLDYFLSFWAEAKFVFGINNNFSDSDQLKTVLAKNIEINSNGTSFDCLDTRFNLQILGKFNIINALSVIALTYSQNISIDKIKPGIEKISGVPGRLERINEGQDYIVIVDYAFEPNAVIKLYETVANIPHNNIIHVLGGTGGGRDVARRPELGRLAGVNANFVIVTNEDPYDDNPEIIIDQVALGAEQIGKKYDINLFKILDRKQAIMKALNIAQKDDVVLITGKGSEQAICVEGGKKIPWDDREVVRELILKK